MHAIVLNQFSEKGCKDVYFGGFIMGNICCLEE